ncbi:major intrinsic protein superfamily membrane channel protein [Suillus clintonianus]|uniref:major intrinsic protein superfamily membrane channel protein n=1 Tax=Suillus clintonianus TaxID=1904413 RepID=UPI001B87362A|nr:major intrinsic protein superfamily membrane channel protein [Suillus clintonianus]KAG2151318.1 major intrinsic protein superfamily membrane channel protein [Suillus clintonianus]
MSEILEKLEEAHVERVSSYDEQKGTPSVNKVNLANCNHCTTFPNRWSRFRYAIREPAAEFLGTMIFVIFGTGVNCQVFLSMNPNVEAVPRGDFLSLNFGWAAGVALGVWIAGGISGGHINPAVTFTLAVFRGFPWEKVPVYIFAQLLGGFCGAGVVYANYFHAIDIVEGGPGIRTISGSGDLLATYAAGFLTPFLGSAILIIGILCVTDKNNGPPPQGLVPLALFIVVLGIGASLGMNTSYSLNPARDLGPRFFTAAAGYGSAVFTYRNQYWLWCIVLGPVIGMLCGAFIYDTLVFQGGESIMNKPNAQVKDRHLRACPGQRGKPSVGMESA